jgi:hypothetical protein
MKLNLKFEEKDFDNFRSFEKAVKRQLGTNVYVGSDSLCFYFDYPVELKAMLKPLPLKEQYEFNLESMLVEQK